MFYKKNGYSLVPEFLPLGHMKQLVYETVVETEENLVAGITVLAGTFADMPGILNGHDNEWSDNVLCAYRPMIAYSSSSCEYHSCN